jgi:hypothetical protein
VLSKYPKDRIEELLQRVELEQLNARGSSLKRLEALADYLRGDFNQESYYLNKEFIFG